MDRPLLLDLFCGAGGAAMGYHRAGFGVVGVDVKPQPRYPFRFVQADALAALGSWNLPAFAAIHASPPCQAYSSTRNMPGAKPHPELVEPVRELLQASGLPYVIENVPGAPLAAHIILCGSMFGLALEDWELRRHRLFETSGFYCLTPPCQHNGRPSLSVTGNFTGRETLRARRRTLGGPVATIAQARALMGIDWMTTAEICQAIPPAYTEFIGGHLMSYLRSSSSSRIRPDARSAGLHVPTD